jgi:ATP-dependent RNA helicase DDX47/RRP3
MAAAREDDDADSAGGSSSSAEAGEGGSRAEERSEDEGGPPAGEGDGDMIIEGSRRGRRAEDEDDDGSSSEEGDDDEDDEDDDDDGDDDGDDDDDLSLPKGDRDRERITSAVGNGGGNGEAEGREEEEGRAADQPPPTTATDAAADPASVGTAAAAAAATGQSVLTAATFASLGVVETLARACEGLGWKTATRIQEQVLPVALEGSDVIGLAETGSGKTAAFCLPLLQLLLRDPPRGITGLILTPTRELAFQIYQVCQALSASMGATCACVVGGVDRASQAVALARSPHVVIATPGRLLDHLKATKGFHLRHVRCLVLDEADRMLSMDFEEELHQIVDQLPSERQTMLFSATMTSQVQKLQRASLRKDAVKIQVNDKFQTPSQLLQYYLFVPAKYKDTYFTFLVNEFAGKSILVFCATCNNAQRLTYMLRNLGFPACALHGQMSQPRRVGMLHKFASGGCSVLICTDVASRGLDLPVVDYVLNYDLPSHGKEYVHRVGRTARAGKSGTALSLVTQYDVEVYQRVESLLGKKLPEYKTDEETVLVLLERVSEAQRLATRELKEQLASRGRGGGRRHRPGGKGGGGDEDGDGELEQALKKQLKRGYAGGSGGHGLDYQRERNKRNRKQRK